MTHEEEIEIYRNDIQDLKTRAKTLWDNAPENSETRKVIAGLLGYHTVSYAEWNDVCRRANELQEMKEALRTLVNFL